jgi:2,4-dienoyl-CoA reductase-like NADH-dependent reductase (Old Yellow Enzyme family)
MRFMRNVIEAVRAAVSGLLIAVRVSVFDLVPYRKREDGIGEPDPDAAAVNHGFGLTHGDQASTEDGVELLTALEQMNVKWICITGGSPYYNPHTQRPALFPPLDGYLPPEDPLRGVARHVEVTARLKQRFPNLVLVGSAYSYLQEWLPHVAQHAVRNGLTDFVGLGRIVLSYPDLPADVLSGTKLRRKSICRTFSDCTTGPRLGMVSGCYPLDPFYMAKPEAAVILKKRPKGE